MEIDRFYYLVTLLIVVMIGLEIDEIIQTECNIGSCQLWND